MAKLNRRAFIGTTVASGVLLGSPGLANAEFNFPKAQTFLKKNSHKHNKHIIVVGAGISGLVAAYNLQNAGYRVTVLEASENIGGRMSSYREGDLVYNKAAQHIFGGYSIIPHLAKELGLDSHFTLFEGLNGFLRKAKIRVVDLYNPLTLFMSGLLERRDVKLRSILALPSFIRSLCAKTTNPESWTELDNESVAHWAKRSFGEKLDKYFFEPIITSLSFNESKTTSKAALISSLHLVFKDKNIYNLEGGIGLIPEKLALLLDVRTNSKVSKVRKVGNKVYVLTEQERLTCDGVVLATPAVQTKHLLRHHETSNIEKRLLDTKYYDGINLALELDKSYSNEVLDKVGNIFTPKDERNMIYLINGSTNNKHNDNRILKILISGPRVNELLNASDEYILSEALKEISTYLPGIEGHINHYKAFRHSPAMPEPAVGRFELIKTYREAASSSPVVFAGDYLSFIHTDGAAESGLWASNQIHKVLN